MSLGKENRIYVCFVLNFYFSKFRFALEEVHDGGEALVGLPPLLKPLTLSFVGCMKYIFVDGTHQLFGVFQTLSKRKKI